MTKAQPIQQHFLHAILRYSGVGLVFVIAVSFAVSLFLTREEMSTNLQETATATAQAFHDRIIDGDIRSVEPQIKQLLKIRSGESVQILKADFSRVYDSFATNEAIKPCQKIGVTCFDGWLGQARILAPVALGAGSSPRYIYIARNIDLNWSFLVTVFVVFTLGYLGLVFVFFRISKIASKELGDELLRWSNRLKDNPKDQTPLSEPPFSELEPLRQALQGLNSQIEKFEKTATDRAKLLILRGIAHDLLTPVARLQLYVDTLEGLVDHERHGDTFAEIRDSLGSVTAIASQVKTLKELDAPAESTELVSSARQEVEFLKTSLNGTNKGIEIEFKSSADNFSAPFSKTELSRIVSNLVKNAADASRPGSLVTVEVGREKGDGFISVRDSGCGISDSTKGRVFDPDFTLKPGTGTGLGLAIVKYICDRRSAQIELQSALNIGTTVTIRVPEVGGPLA